MPEIKFLHCKICKCDLPKDAFSQSYRRKDNVGGNKCRECVAKMNASWYMRNKEKAKSDMREYRKRIKDEVFDHYGRVCLCCGEQEVLFLDIDHINNDGAEHRKANNLTAGTQFYIWLRGHDFPANYQTLCCNCNRGKFRNNGVCPHKQAEAT